jgi:hypothetical protein
MNLALYRIADGYPAQQVAGKVAACAADAHRVGYLDICVVKLGFDVTNCSLAW